MMLFSSQRIVLIFFLSLFGTILSAFAQPHRVVSTTGMVGDLVREVVGPHAQVQVLMGEGSDPHLYTPNRNDVVALRQAYVIFYNGLLLEGQMGDILSRMARRGKKVIAVAEEIQRSEEYELLLEDENEFDPHLWMDVQAWQMALSVIVRAMSDFDPANASEYRANAEAFQQRLITLDTYARETLATIPENRRVLITAHDAFGYLGRAYGIEVRGIQGLSTESEAGVRDIENLVSFLIERQIPAIFIESSVPDRNVRAVIEGARARGHQVRVGGELFSDAMGKAGTHEGTYVGMIEHNVNTITRALGGVVPQPD